MNGGINFGPARKSQELNVHYKDEAYKNERIEKPLEKQMNILLEMQNEIVSKLGELQREVNEVKIEIINKDIKSQKELADLAEKIISKMQSQQNLT